LRTHAAELLIREVADEFFQEGNHFFPLQVARFLFLEMDANSTSLNFQTGSGRLGA
jgi:hypothetical protein